MLKNDGLDGLLEILLRYAEEGPHFFEDDAMRVHDLVLECEHPAEAPDPSIARRRIGFYLRAGARATALESRVFGTRYAVLALPCGGTVPDAALCKELRTLYKVMVPHPYYRGQVIFYGS